MTEVLYHIPKTKDLPVCQSRRQALIHKFTTALRHRLRHVSTVTIALVAFILLAACQPVGAPAATDTTIDTDAPATLVIYSGRNENLVGPLIEQFSDETGIPTEVRYGGTAEMAVTILEEGANSPADIFFAQDAGALGELSNAGRLSVLPEDILATVPASLQSEEGDWVGISGRVRVLAYNTVQLSEDELPDTIWELLDPQWQGRVGWAPTNGSFQSFVTALRVLEGEERAREWLEGMLANDVQVYPNNTTIVSAVASGEILVGLVNHYYLYRFLSEEGEGFTARNYFFPEAHAGSMNNVAGVGIVDTANNRAEAEAFIRFLLSPTAQEFFVQETSEYALIDTDVAPMEFLPSLDEIATPEIDLSDLADLQGTLELLQDVGALD